MNILLAGGACSLMDGMIRKFRKEGHRIFILTGNKYRHNKYEKVFEKYEFPYDSDNLSTIVESINADVTILLGAFDTNYYWREEHRETVHFISHLINILVAFSMTGKGKLFFLSSDEVYSGDYKDDIQEIEKCTGNGMRAQTLAQAEQMCNDFRENHGIDITILRLDHLYSIPKEKIDVNNICARMCLECMSDGQIKVEKDHVFSLLYENDAVEYIYRAAVALKNEYHVYHLSSNEEISEMALAAMIQEKMKTKSDIISLPCNNGRCVLSGNRFEKEYGVHAFANLNEILNKMIPYMQKHRELFVNGDKEEIPWWKQLFNRWKWFVQAIFPFVENIICFLPFFMMNNRMAGSQYFAKLDLFLLYVLLFAIVYGQQQATFSAMLAVAGYMFRQMYTRSSFEILLDYNTYVWIAQLFILGLVVGYMRDRIKTMQMESRELEEHLSRQVADIRDINESNIRVKDVMEQQLINHKDSIGKIYSITEVLDQRMPDEVMFYAVEMLMKLMQTKDVALYNVVNNDYARVFSASSAKARSLGNSIRYKEMTEMYHELNEKKVYINKNMDGRYPLMAKAIYEGEQLKMILMLWGLSWEQMTLGQANFLTVISYLIQNAVLRAQRYMQALEDKRYSENSRILEAEAFQSLVHAYTDAANKNLAECILLKVCVPEENYREVDEKMTRRLRGSDYLGLLSDGNLYVLLTNTTAETAIPVQDRFKESGYETKIMEKMVA